MATTATPKPTLYNAIWRWHFYAGLFCIPLVIWLALTGSIYLWRPQVEAWLDKPYDHLATSGPVATPEAQVAAALKELVSMDDGAAVMWPWRLPTVWRRIGVGRMCIFRWDWRVS